MSGAICDGIERTVVRVRRCPVCHRRRRMRVHFRYDSILAVCSRGHELVSE